MKSARRSGSRLRSAAECGPVLPRGKSYRVTQKLFWSIQLRRSVSVPASILERLRILVHQAPEAALPSARPQGGAGRPGPRVRVRPDLSSPIPRWRRGESEDREKWSSPGSSGASEWLPESKLDEPLFLIDALQREGPPEPANCPGDAVDPSCSGSSSSTQPTTPRGVLSGWEVGDSGETIFRRSKFN